MARGLGGRYAMLMRRLIALVVMLAVAGVAITVAAASFDDSPEPSPAPARPTPSQQPAAATPAPEPAVAQASATRSTLSSRSVSPYGRILTDARGYTLYIFTKEQGSPPSECYGACAKAWPPFLTEGRPRAGRGIDAGKLAVTRRRGGRRQVTYNGHPLYYYVGERQPLLVLCHNVVEFGGTWLVADTRGNARP
jgi:predicted lipoprotein with Yx(FWY)xxD motif